MTHHVNDRWLWLDAGVALFIAVKSISYAIHDIVRLTEVQPISKENDEENQNQPEDSISLDVLHTLATSPNPNISKSAIDLIAARCTKSKPLISSMQADANSSDPVLRHKARTALSFLGSWSLGGNLGNEIPPGMRTGGSTGALNLSPSMLSVDNVYEFDQVDGTDLPLRNVLAGGTLDDYVEADVDRSVLPNPGMSMPEDMRQEAETRRRRRELMVLHEGSGRLMEEDIIHPRTM